MIKDLSKQGLGMEFGVTPENVSTLDECFGE
jgi:hypothetical protein